MADNDRRTGNEDPLPPPSTSQGSLETESQPPTNQASLIKPGVPSIEQLMHDAVSLLLIFVNELVSNREYNR